MLVRSRRFPSAACTQLASVIKGAGFRANRSFTSASQPLAIGLESASLRHVVNRTSLCKACSHEAFQDGRVAVQDCCYWRLTSPWLVRWH
eukprot:6468542-Amphidinium_carterae.1